LPPDGKKILLFSFSGLCHTNNIGATSNLIFLVCPIWLPVFFLFFYNEPEVGAGIIPGMALTPFPSSILN